MSKAPLLLMGLSLGVSAADLEEVLKGRGVWWKNPVNYSDALVQRLDDIGVRRVHIMLTEEPIEATKCAPEEPASLSKKHQAKKPIPLASLNQVDKLVKALRAKDMYVIATVYLPPTKVAIDDLLDSRSDLVPALLAGGIDAVELDLEGTWKRNAVCGYKTHAEAFQDFKDRVKSMRPGVPVGITTHGSHIGAKEIPLGAADFVSMQAYSKCEDDCKAFDDKRTGPGNRQRYVVGKMEDIKGPIVLGLAAYGQQWNGYTWDAAMGKALSATESIMANDQRVVGYSYWSSNSFDGSSSRNKPYQFLLKHQPK
ncbi:hypothetical protein A7D21_28235 [Pseudomonas sp. AP19]|uniref:hypothetical protein n=1 Tax=Pseudomonas TaxID=286 RepID=UPI00084B5B00|nr:MULTISPECIES: hypothetical protein [Pseudomonas]MBC8785609.1 hypothetical protein [Pseudomonas fluorescens]OEC67926.1 hypothetical protein A7D21_28235 [Pseudomonas sp. AP19]